MSELLLVFVHLAQLIVPNSSAKGVIQVLYPFKISLKVKQKKQAFDAVLKSLPGTPIAPF